MSGKSSLPLILSIPVPNFMKWKLRLFFIVILVGGIAAIKFFVPWLAERFSLSDLQTDGVLAITALLFAVLAAFSGDFIVWLPMEEYERHLLRSDKKRKTFLPSAKIFPEEIMRLDRSLQQILLSERQTAKTFQRMASYNDIRRRFISTVSHQLRTPITGLQWSLGELSSKSENKSEEDKSALMKGTLDSIGRLSELVEELVQAVQFEGDELLKKIEDVNMMDIADAVIKESKLLAMSKNILLRYEQLKPSIPTIQGNRQQLRLAIHNLVSNAIRYSNANGEVLILIDAKGDHVEITVKDKGIGIPRDEQVLLFEPLSRGKEAFRFNPEGTGLGLYLTKNIITEHDGGITVKSEEGKGTEFTLHLPLKQKGQLETMIQP